MYYHQVHRCISVSDITTLHTVSIAVQAFARAPLLVIIGVLCFALKPPQ
jgi:hypothetical protein